MKRKRSIDSLDNKIFKIRYRCLGLHPKRHRWIKGKIIEIFKEKGQVKAIVRMKKENYILTRWQIKARKNKKHFP